MEVTETTKFTGSVFIFWSLTFRSPLSLESACRVFEPATVPTLSKVGLGLLTEPNTVESKGVVTSRITWIAFKQHSDICQPSTNHNSRLLKLFSCCLLIFPNTVPIKFKAVTFYNGCMMVNMYQCVLSYVRTYRVHTFFYKRVSVLTYAFNEQRRLRMMDSKLSGVSSTRPLVFLCFALLALWSAHLIWKAMSHALDLNFSASFMHRWTSLRTLCNLTESSATVWSKMRKHTYKHTQDICNTHKLTHKLTHTHTHTHSPTHSLSEFITIHQVTKGKTIKSLSFSLTLCSSWRSLSI